MTTETIRVMLTDDHHVVRTGLRAVLSAAKDVVVVAEAASGREAIALASRVQPDVILMDLSMSDIDGTRGDAADHGNRADIRACSSSRCMRKRNISPRH